MPTFPPVYNNVSTVLRQNHNTSDGLIRVATGAGLLFGSTFPIRITCQRVSDNAVVIFNVTSRAGDDLTVTTTEGTTDIDLATGDICEMRFTAGAISDIQDNLVYTTSSPTTSTVGGIPAGSTFTDELLVTIIDQILHAYLAPAFTSFGITGASTQEVGQTFSGSKTFTWSTSNSSNVATNSISIDDTTNSTNLGNSLPNNGSTSFSINVSHNAPATHIWTITGQNTQSGSFSTTTSINWLWRLYYGTSVSITLNAAGIQGLASSTLTSGFASTYSYGTGGFKYISFPDSFGGPSSFKDASTQLNVAMCDSTDDPSYSNTQNGFNYALVSVTNTHGVATNYRLYRSKNILGGSINIIIS
jgi:hypothetical protein